MSAGLSHITLITADLDRMQAVIETVLRRHQAGELPAAQLFRQLI